MKILRYCIILFLFVSSAGAASFNLENLLERQNLSNHFSYVEDRDKSLTIRDMQSRKTGWKRITGESVNFGFTYSAYWFTFNLDNTSSKTDKYYIEISYPLLDYVHLYIPDGKGSFIEKKTGDLYPFEHRDVNDETFLFPVDISPGVHTFYLRVETSSSLNFIPLLWTPEGYLNYYNREMPVTWIYYGLLLVMALYNLFLFVSIRERSYIYYALFIFFWVLFELNLRGYAFQYLWPDSIWWANNSLPFFMCSTMILVGFFGRNYVELYKKDVVLDKMLLYALLAPLFVCGVYSLVGRYSIAIRVSTFLAIYYSIGIYCLLLYLTVIKKNRQAFFLTVGFNMLVIGLVLFILKTFGLFPANFVTQYSMQFGASALVVLLSLGMADKINVMQHELRDLNQNLEIKVEKRTEELNNAMAELEAMNENLVAANEELEEAQVKMNKDMQLAAYVQKKYFPEIQPETENWEVAFYFRPMSGVSGDLYDFYTKGNMLEGLSIFDVSGHGLASGLITMIARSLLQRNFNAGKDLELNKVLENTNEELIEEIGNVGNYLTGIMLRFEGDTVQYVNAGHPDLLMRSSKTGSVKAIKQQGDKHKGAFLGLRIMNGSYALTRLKADRGDSLLMFTDCLYEAVNPGCEEFGIDRIYDAFSRAPANSAQNQLSFILQNFYSFIEKEALSDDLSVIIARKIV